MNRNAWWVTAFSILFLGWGFLSYAKDAKKAKPKPTETKTMSEKIDWKKMPDSWWKERLEPEAYKVLRHGGTECAFTGKLWDHHEKGVFSCAGCGLPLFVSDSKFESGTGWPSFFQPIDAKAVESKVDKSYGMVRTEVNCSRCGGHLGHVFEDGPKPTGLRFCINSVSLKFEKK